MSSLPMTSQELANTITYLRKVFVGPFEVDNFLSTLSALEREYQRVRKEEQKKVSIHR